MTTSDARIHDLGYRGYEGERSGVGWAMVSLGTHAAQRVLGLKRPARHKVLPAICILITFIPALVFVGMAAFLGDTVLEDDVLPSYADFFGLIVVAIFLFSSFVAPEAICTDRRTGMLALYLASPLNRTTYIVSKVGSVAITLLTITLFPLLFLLIAYTLAGAGPDGATGFIELFGRIVLTGLLAAAYFGAFTAMVSSFTTRKGIASASIVITYLVSSIVAGALIEGADVDDKIALINLANLPIRAGTWLLGEPATGDAGLDQVDGGLVTLVSVGAIAVFGAVTWWRYQKLEVDR